MKKLQIMLLSLVVVGFSCLISMDEPDVIAFAGINFVKKRGLFDYQLEGKGGSSYNQKTLEEDTLARGFDDILEDIENSSQSNVLRGLNSKNTESVALYLQGYAAEPEVKKVRKKGILAVLPRRNTGNDFKENIDNVNLLKMHVAKSLAKLEQHEIDYQLKIARYEHQ